MITKNPGGFVEMLYTDKLRLIALRKYYKRGFWHAEAVRHVMCGQDNVLYTLLSYNLGDETEIKNEISDIKDLASKFSGDFIDILSNSECYNLTCFLPDALHAKKMHKAMLHLNGMPENEAVHELTMLAEIAAKRKDLQ